MVKLITVDVHVDVDAFWLSVLNENLFYGLHRI